MGLFDKLFGSSAKDNKAGLRDKLKNKRYFKSEVSRCEKWINNDTEDFAKYIEQHGELSPFHYISACTIRLDKFSNLYSQGESVEKITPVFKEALEFFLKGWSEGYKGCSLILQMLSLTILLDLPKEDFEKVIDFIEKTDHNKIAERLKPDSLLFYLSGQKNKKRAGYKPYEMLYQISQLPVGQTEHAIKNYLNKWYDLHKEAAWYNTHLRDWGYSGYWAWEVAAVVKVMGLDDSSFKDHPHYPYDLVHWKD
jgi:hypothetical protein